MLSHITRAKGGAGESEFWIPACTGMTTYDELAIHHTGRLLQTYRRFRAGKTTRIPSTFKP